MPPPSDRDNPATLPELNPLLNPTLGNNMGRWAEVYFTSPPERRDQAVLELLRELEGQTAPSQTDRAQTDRSQTDRAPLPSFQPVESATAHRSRSQTAEAQVKASRCHACGYVNRSRNKFCGRCGEPLAAVPSHAPFEEVPADGGRLSPYFTDPASTTDDFPRGDRGVRFGDSSPIWALDAVPRRHSYRPYAGAVLALLIMALVYLGWRGTIANSGTSRATPPSPPVVANAPDSPVSVPANPSANTTARVPSARGMSSASLPAGSNSGSTNQSSTNQGPANQGPANPAQPNPAQPLPASSASGFEELATARDYLDGRNGREHNSSEAAQWLWKAVAKQNADATLLLSGLYLRGDGVSKSCDQARLLLDAAASKGRKDAAEMLRNLQAFGCE